MTTIRDQIYDIVASTLDIRRADIRPSAGWQDYGADSLAIVETVFAIQEHFKITLVDSLKNVHSIQDLVSIVESQVLMVGGQILPHDANTVANWILDKPDSAVATSTGNKTKALALLLAAGKVLESGGYNPEKSQQCDRYQNAAAVLLGNAIANAQECSEIINGLGPENVKGQVARSFPKLGLIIKTMLAQSSSLVAQARPKSEPVVCGTPFSPETSHGRSFAPDQSGRRVIPKPTQVGGAAEFCRQNQLRNLTEAMRRANVPESTINQIVEEDALTDYFVGYVIKVLTLGETTMVTCRGPNGDEQFHEYMLSFPPNRPEVLAELIRAQNHPHFRIQFAATRKSTDLQAQAVVQQLIVFLDYDEPPIDYAPSFDEK